MAVLGAKLLPTSHPVESAHARACSRVHIPRSCAPTPKSGTNRRSARRTLGNPYRLVMAHSPEPLRRRPLAGILQLTTSSWHHSKLEYGTRAILLPRAQNRRRKVRMVRRIGVMLRLQRQAITEMIDSAAFAGDAAIEEIAGIKLEARLGSGDLHRATTRWLDDARSEYQHI